MRMAKALLLLCVFLCFLSVTMGVMPKKVNCQGKPTTLEGTLIDTTAPTISAIHTDSVDTNSRRGEIQSPEAENTEDSQVTEVPTARTNLNTKNPSTIPQWLLVAATLLLVVVALFGPYLAEWWKRKFFAPKLKIEFSLKNPYCHLTKRANQSSVFYFRFAVANEGKSQAKFCEAVLEELWLEDNSGNLKQYENFSPVNLIWVGHYELRLIPDNLGRIKEIRVPEQFIDINPKRHIFCDIGHISDPEFQKSAEKSKYHPHRQDLKFFLDTTATYFSQPDCILPGRAKIKIAVYSENAPTCEKYFHIRWSGNWTNQEQDMFKEIVISE